MAQDSKNVRTLEEFRRLWKRRGQGETSSLGDQADTLFSAFVTLLVPFAFICVFRVFSLMMSLGKYARRLPQLKDKEGDQHTSHPSATRKRQAGWERMEKSLSRRLPSAMLPHLRWLLLHELKWKWFLSTIRE